MEPTYPITRKQLQTYDDIYTKMVRQAFINTGIEYISNEILTKALTRVVNPNGLGYGQNYQTFCEFKIDQIIGHCTGNFNSVYTAVRDGPFQPYLTKILAGVMERFPDCIFTQDPTKKYLFVDWS